MMDITPSTRMVTIIVMIRIGYAFIKLILKICVRIAKYILPTHSIVMLGHRLSLGIVAVQVSIMNVISAIDAYCGWQNYYYDYLENLANIVKTH